MSRSDIARLDDILESITAIEGYITSDGVQPGLVFDAVRMRLIEIGEAANCLDLRTLEFAPQLPWKEIISMRHILTHKYFDTLFSEVKHTAENDLKELRINIETIKAKLS